MHLNVRVLFEIISHRDEQRIDALMNHFRRERNHEYIEYVLSNSIDGEDQQSIDE